MKKSKAAKSSAEFDRRFDDGEDIHDLIDMSQATVLKQGKKVHITLDVAESLVKEIDALWAKEAERRVKDIKTGAVDAIPGEKVFQKISDRRKS